MPKHMTKNASPHSISLGSELEELTNDFHGKYNSLIWGKYHKKVSWSEATGVAIEVGIELLLKLSERELAEIYKEPSKIKKIALSEVKKRTRDNSSLGEITDSDFQTIAGGSESL